MSIVLETIERKKVIWTVIYLDMGVDTQCIYCCETSFFLARYFHSGRKFPTHLKQANVTPIYEDGDIKFREFEDLFQ